jgi:hypothetical protein
MSERRSGPLETAQTLEPHSFSFPLPSKNERSPARCGAIDWICKFCCWLPYVFAPMDGKHLVRAGRDYEPWVRAHRPGAAPGFNENPTKSFRTSVLCKFVYGVEQVEKKHRVSVLRALRTLVSRGLIPIAGWVPEFEKNDVEWFNFRIVGLPRGSFVLRPRRAGRSSRSAGPAAKLKPMLRRPRR